MKTLKTLVITIPLLLAGTAMPTTALAVDGRHHMMGGQHGSSHWKNTLSDEQKNKLRVLKLKKKKQIIPLKLKIKQARVELAMLTGNDKPKQAAIDKKIGEIVKLKQKKMQLKAKHKIAVRKLLNSNQKVMFDLRLLKKAKKGKRCKHGMHK